MNVALVHFLTRVRLITRMPGVLFMHAIAALSSLAFWPLLLSAADFPGESADLDEPVRSSVILVFSLTMVLCWPMLIGFFGAGGLLETLLPDKRIRLPFPALPIVPRRRILLDALAALAIVWVLRIPAAFVLLPLLDLIGLELDTSWLLRVMGEESLRGSVLFLPLVVAWLAPGRLGLVYWTRALTPSVVLVAAVQLGWLTSTPLALAVGLGGLAFVMLTLPYGHEEPAPRARRTPRVSSRPALAPASRLWRDALLLPLRRHWGFVVAAIVSQLLLLLLALGMDNRQTLLYGVWHLPAYLVLNLTFFPFGMKLLIASGLGRAQRSALLDTFSTLPVRRESAARAVFVNTSVWTVAAWCFMWCGYGLARLLGLEEPGLVRLLGPALLATPAYAGLMTTLAAGEKGRTAIAIAASLAALLGFNLLLVLGAPDALRFPFYLLCGAVGVAAAWRPLRGPVREA